MTSQPLSLHTAQQLAGALPPLLVAAQHLTNSVLPGAHGRRRAGPGAEFWQFRPASSGDSALRIDWRRSGRGDDLFVRETEWQAARAVTLWVDPGAAMRFSGDANRPEKGARAQLLALALGLSLLKGGERVGLAQADTPPRGGRAQAERLALGLGTQQADERGAIDLSGAPQAGHVVLFSDFLGPLNAIDAALATAAERGMKGVLVQILDPVEEVFPFDGRTRFESLSGDASFETLRAADLRAEYLDRLAQRKARLAALAQGAGWHATVMHTDRPAAEGLVWLHQALGGFA